jgi:deoxyribose-phosphate aldolase
VEDTPGLTALAKMIDHSLLHPTMTDEEIVAGCTLAKRCAVATACVKPYAIQLARSVLDGSGVGFCAVFAFPHWYRTTSM